MCAGCGTPIDSEGTLVMLAQEPTDDAMVLLRGRPIEFPATVHRVHRRPLRMLLAFLTSARRRRARAHRERISSRLSRQLDRHG
jgi:hypothetical protein